MAKIKWIDDRLTNWALWCERGGIGGLGYGHVMWNNVPSGGGNAGSVVPVNDMEASEIDAEIKRLDKDLQRLLALYYQVTETRTELAVRLGCATATIDSRLTRAHKLLAAAIGERERQAKARSDAYRASAIKALAKI